MDVRGQLRDLGRDLARCLPRASSSMIPLRAAPTILRRITLEIDARTILASIGVAPRAAFTAVEETRRDAMGPVMRVFEGAHRQRAEHDLPIVCL